MVTFGSLVEEGEGAAQSRAHTAVNQCIAARGRAASV